MSEQSPHVGPLMEVKSTEWRVSFFRDQIWVPALVRVYDVPHGHPVAKAPEREEPGPVITDVVEHCAYISASNFNYYMTSLPHLLD